MSASMAQRLGAALAALAALAAPALAELSRARGPRWQQAQQGLAPLNMGSEHAYGGWSTTTLPPDYCECQNWKRLFATEILRCGMGFELMLSKPSAKESVANEVWNGGLCKDMFSKLNDNSCVNLNMGQAEGQWCYVSHKCFNLTDPDTGRMGHKVAGANDDWGWSTKPCNPKKDKMLMQKSPEQLAEFAAKHHVDMLHLVKMAYPTIYGVAWEDVEKIFAQKDTDLSEEQLNKVQTIVSSNRPVVWGSKKEQPPFGVSMGMKAWEVGVKLFGKTVLLDHPDSVDIWANHTKFHCVYGCTQTGKGAVMSRSPGGQSVLQFHKKKKIDTKSKKASADQRVVQLLKKRKSKE